MTHSETLRLGFVSCASDQQVLVQRLLASPCLGAGGHRLALHFNASSAAEGFNATMAAQAVAADEDRWLVWVHQDVFLPLGWDLGFTQALIGAQRQFRQLAVVGVYGVAGAGALARRAGHVRDRGTLLREPAALPMLVDSLDEMLFAVRVGSQLQLDPALGFDFYATDLVLQAQARGLQCAVVDACCEHWSSTPSSGAAPRSLLQRIEASARVFEAKWAQRLPISTPCFDMGAAGDVAAFIAAHFHSPP